MNGHCKCRRRLGLVDWSSSLRTSSARRPLLGDGWRDLLEHQCNTTHAFSILVHFDDAYARS